MHALASTLMDYGAAEAGPPPFRISSADRLGFGPRARQVPQQHSP